MTSELSNSRNNTQDKKRQNIQERQQTNYKTERGLHANPNLKLANTFLMLMNDIVNMLRDARELGVLLDKGGNNRKQGEINKATRCRLACRTPFLGYTLVLKQSLCNNVF